MGFGNIQRNRDRTATNIVSTPAKKRRPPPHSGPPSAQKKKRRPSPPDTYGRHSAKLGVRRIINFRRPLGALTTSSSAFRKSLGKATTTAVVVSSNDSRNDRNGSKSGSHDEDEPLPVNLQTAKIIRRTVLEMLQSSSVRSATVLNLAITLGTNQKCLESYSGDTPRRFPFKRIGRFVRGVFDGGQAKEEEQTIVDRKYAWVNALRRLKHAPESRDTQVSSWKEAKASLETALVFPEGITEDDDDDDDPYADDPYADLIALIEEEADGREEPENSTAETHRKKLDVDLTKLGVAMQGLGVSATGHRWRKVEALADVAINIQDADTEELERRACLAMNDLEFNAYVKSKQELEMQRRKIPAVVELEERLKAKEAEEEAKKRASSLMRPLSDEELQIVHDAVDGYGGRGDDIVAQCGSDTVQRSSMQSLQPGTWVGDEIIHYFYLMLGNRDEEMCKQDPSRKRSHFFKSFFMTKLLNEGHHSRDGQYEYNNVKRWSKKVPGKDIFDLNKILFPINMGNSHWIAACIFMQEKRIEIFDSMGGSGRVYLQALLQYLDDEHKSKKNCPLPDRDQWELVSTRPETPRQRNGYDCGVFTCMFADFVSKDCPLVFTQDHIHQCRHRIALSIMKGKAIM